MESEVSIGICMLREANAGCGRWVSPRSYISAPPLTALKIPNESDIVDADADADVDVDADASPRPPWFDVNGLVTCMRLLRLGCRIDGSWNHTTWRGPWFLELHSLPAVSIVLNCCWYAG